MNVINRANMLTDVTQGSSDASERYGYRGGVQVLSLSVPHCQPGVLPPVVTRGWSA